MDFEYVLQDLGYSFFSLQDDDKRKIRSALLDNKYPRGQLEAILSLAEWSRTHSSSGRRLLDRRIGRQLARFLSKSQKPDLNVKAAKVLPIISGALDDDVLLAFFESLPYMRDTLLNSLSDKQNPCLQVETARLVADAISWGGYMSFPFDRIGDVSKTFYWAHGMMERLASSLSEVQNPDLPDLQVEAARVYSNLSSLPDYEIHTELLNLPGMLNMLLDSFSNEQHPRLQVQAARLLANVISLGLHTFFGKIFRSRMMKELVSKAQEAAMSGMLDDDLQKAFDQLVIKNHRGMLDTLMASLSDQRKPLVQVEAARLLADVTRSENNELCRETLWYPRMMETLARSVSMDRNPHLQEEARRVLSHILGSSDDEYRRVLLERSGMILDILVARLVDNLISDDPRLQVKAARFLPDVKQLRNYELRSNSKMMETLARLMSRHEDAAVQIAAARVLSSILGSADDDSFREFLDLPGMLNKLVDSLVNDRNRQFREVTASLVASAAERSKYDEFCNRLLRSRGIMELLKLLAKGEDPDLQVEAARVLCDVTEVADEIFRDMLLEFLLSNDNGMLKTLVAALSDDQELRVRVEAARLLASITRWKDYNLCSKILWDPGMKRTLATIVWKGQNPDLLVEVARVFCDISEIPDENFREELFDILVKDSDTLVTLMASFYDEQNPRVRRGYHDTLKAMTNLLFQHEDRHLKVETVTLFANITGSRNYKFFSKIFWLPGMTEKLANSFLEHQKPDLQAEAATVFCNISGFSDGELFLPKFFNLPGVLDTFVTSLFNEQNRRLQVVAARLLVNITQSRTYDLCIKILRFPGTMEKLASSLSKDQNPDLQVQVATVFRKMSELPDYDFCGELLNLHGMLGALVASLSNKENSRLQVEAARLLAKITESGKHELYNKVIQFSGMKKQLGNSLSNENPGLLAEVARVFRHISGCLDDVDRYKLSNVLKKMTSETEKKHPLVYLEASMAAASLSGSKDEVPWQTIGYFTGKMEPLKLLLSDSDRSLEAARVLRRLSGLKTDVLRSKIIFFPDMVEKLLGALSLDQNPDLLVEVTCVFVNLLGLCSEHNRGKVMAKLVTLLSKDHDPDLQLGIIRVVAGLSSFKYVIWREIPQSIELLENLACFFLRNGYPSLQVNAVSVFADVFALKDDVLTKQILEKVPDVLAKLRALLLENGNPLLQEAGARTLANLICTKDDANWTNLVHFPDMVEKLVNGVNVFADVFALEDDVLTKQILENVPDVLAKLRALLLENGNPLLQEAGARTLANLTCTKDDANRTKLVHFPRLMTTLANSFIQQGNREVQLEAARAFVNLTYMKYQTLRKRDICVPDLLEGLAKSSMQKPESYLQVQRTGEFESSASTGVDAVGDDETERSAFSEEMHALQAEAARILINWTVSEDSTFKGGRILWSSSMLVWVGAEGRASGMKCEVKLEQLTPQLRQDIQSLGLTTWDRKFNPQNMFALYDVRTHPETGQERIDFMFFHAEATARLFGVGLRHAIVSVSQHPLEIMVEDIDSKQWKDAWMDSYTGSFKPMIFSRLDESFSSSNDQDVPDGSGSLKSGEVKSSIRLGLLYKKWVEDFTRYLREDGGVGKDVGAGAGAETGNNEVSGFKVDKSGDTRNNQVDDTDNDEGGDTGNNEGSDSGSVHHRSDGSKNDQYVSSKSHEGDVSKHFEGETQDVGGDCARNCQPGNSGSTDSKEDQGGYARSTDSGKDHRGDTGSGDNGDQLGDTGCSNNGENQGGDTGSGDIKSGDGGKDQGGDNGNDQDRDTGSGDSEDSRGDDAESGDNGKDRSGDSGSGDNQSQGGDTGDGEENNPKDLVKSQTNGTVVVFVRLIRKSPFFVTFNDYLKHKVDSNIQRKIKDAICGTTTTVACGKCTVVPDFKVEFIWEGQQKSAIIDFNVAYNISGTHRDDCGWYQNNFQMSFSCAEDEDKQMAIKIAADEILSAVRDVPVETTHKTGQSTIGNTSFSGQAGFGLDSTNAKLQLGKQKSSKKTSGEQLVLQTHYKCLAHPPTFVLKDSQETGNDLSWEASYLRRIESDRHWEEEKWETVCATGLYKNLCMSIRGTWGLMTDGDDEQVKFKFAAAKQLKKCTPRSDETKVKLSQLVKGYFSRQKVTSSKCSSNTEITEVWQGITRELILDHNFLKKGLHGFNCLKSSKIYTIKDPIEEDSVNLIEEVVARYYPHLYNIVASSSC